LRIGNEESGYRGPNKPVSTEPIVALNPPRIAAEESRYRAA
jgi:hypothetical protein